MAYSFGTRHDYLRTRMRAVNSRDVVYRRGALSAEVQATVYEMRDEDKVNFGVPLGERRIDYIIDNDEVIAAVGNPFTGPEQNDEIVDATIGVVCKVVPMTDGQCFKYTNNRRAAFRIHSLVDEEL
jgi:hypothetical protein